MFYIRLAPPWGPILGAATASAVAFGLAAWARDGLLAWTLLRAAMAGLGVATAMWIDDPAAEVVAAVPRSLSWQRVRRTAVLVVPLSVAACGLAAWTARVPTAPYGALVLEAIGIMLLAMASALLVRRTGRETPGEVSGSAVALVVVGVALFNPKPETLPFFPDGQDHWAASSALWAMIIGCSALALLLDTHYRPEPRRLYSSAARRARDAEHQPLIPEL